jgi:hypothetical protein
MAMRNWRALAAASAAAFMALTSIVVATPHVAEVAAIGPTTGSVSGTISPIGVMGSVQVQLLDAGFTPVQSTFTAGGPYAFDDVAPGDYYVSANVPVAGTMLVPQVFHPGTYTQSSAQQIHVVATEALTGVDIAVPALGSISGHVNGNTGGVPLAQVNIRRADGTYAGSTQANNVGAYTVSNVLPGSYYVQTFTTDPVNGMLEVYHPSALSLATATAVVVGDGTALQNIDVTLPSPASISGTLTGTDAELVKGATVYLLKGSTYYPIATTSTNTLGQYSFDAVPFGRDLTLWVVPANGSPYLGEWYLDKTDFPTATRFTLAPGEARAIDFELAVGASVDGHITNAAGAPIDGWVTVFSTDNGSFQAQVINGAYHIPAIKPGTYVAYVAPGDPNTGSDYAPEYYGESYSQSGATAITLGQGQIVTGIDIEVAIGGRIEGRVTDPLGQPVSGVNVDGGSMNAPSGLFSANSQGYTGGDGSYVLRGLAPGTFDIALRPATVTGLLTTTINRTVASGQTLSGVDVQLQRGAVGTVTLHDDNGIVTDLSFYTGPIVCAAGSVFTTSYNCELGGTAIGVTTGIVQPGGGGSLIGPLAPGDYWAAGFSLSMGSQTGTQVPLTITAGDSFHCDLTLPGTTTFTASCHITPPHPSGTIRGRVTGATGAGVAGVDVTAEYPGANNQDVALLTRVTTDALGYYTMPAVLAGSYRIRFQPQPNSPGLSMQWWTNDGTMATAALDGDLLTVTDGQTISGIDIRLVQNGSGTAVITNNGLPAPQSSGTVAAMCHAPAHYLGAFFNCSDNSPAILAFYDATSQRYVWQTIPPGTYNVRAADVFHGPRLGAETSVNLFSADTIDCTLPFETTGTASCTVTHTLSDTDGVSNTVEDAAPNAGDGNGDGTPDAVQANVTSVADPTIAPGTTQANYITLAVDPANNAGNGYPLSAVTVTDPPPSNPAPSGATPQTGLIGFDVVDLPTAGAPATVTLDLYLGSLANSYWKYDQVHGWRDFTSLATFDPTPVSIGGVNRFRVTLTITDNGFGDEDPAQGVISDPGVFAFVDPDHTPPGIVWNGGIAAGQAFDFGLVPPSPTCTATDAGSGPADCAVTGYSPAVGTHVLTAVAHDLAGNETLQTRSYTVRPYTLKGFQKPVDMGGVWNTMKPGKTVSFRFEIFRGTTELTSVAAVQSFRYTTVSCASGSALEDPVEIVSAEDDGLEYEVGPGEFRLKWKTPNRPNACLKATLTTVDGSTLSALFKLK